MPEPSLLEDLRAFVALHRAHGELHANAGDPTPNGYRLEVTCPCSVVFERWVLPDDAAVDMALLARWNCSQRPQHPRRVLIVTADNVSA